ncbi:MAG TPA: universal stress protein, partial [Gammaproteobacteria bacterium]|nr:universal stress protein [Gammaproteobacteria bacterium]
TVWGIPAYEAIAAAARDWPADLLVVGAHEPQSQHARLTDTDWQLMRRASCPLLLVKSAAFDGYDQIVAAVEGADGGDEVVLAAGRCFARAFGSTLAVVEVGALGEAVGRRACLVVVRAPVAAVPGELEAAAETVVNSAPCDVLLVPPRRGSKKLASSVHR